jgi:hypothetical protein
VTGADVEPRDRSGPLREIVVIPDARCIDELSDRLAKRTGERDGKEHTDRPAKMRSFGTQGSASFRSLKQYDTGSAENQGDAGETKSC